MSFLGIEKFLPVLDASSKALNRLGSSDEDVKMRETPEWLSWWSCSDGVLYVSACLDEHGLQYLLCPIDWGYP